MNKALFVLVLTTAGASLACMHLVRELRDERARVATLEARITQLEQAAQSREETVIATLPVNPFSSHAQHNQSQISAEVSQATAHTDALAGAAPGAMTPTEHERSSHEQRAHQLQARMREQMDRQRELMQDPQYRDAMRRQQRARMVSTYPGLREALGLSPEQADRFLDLLADHQVSEMQHMDFMHAHKDANELQRTQAAMQERYQRHQEELETQFGPGIQQRWREYQETLGQRHRVAALQSELAMAGVPLDRDQSQALLNALVDEHRRQTQELTAGTLVANAMMPVGSASHADPSKWVEAQERAHERLLSSLQSTLSTQQLGRLEEMFAREREVRRASMELMRAQGLETPAMMINHFGAVPTAGFSVPITVIEGESTETN